MSLSPGQIAYLAQRAGIPDNQLQTATAIALAESGGDAAEVTDNPGTGDLSYGLWQINMIGSMGPERRQQYGLASNDDLKDPATNARVMAAMSNKGTNWGPWTTFTRGTYHQNQYWGPAGTGVANPQTVVGKGTNPTGIAGTIDKAIGGAADAASSGLSLALPSELTAFLTDAEKAVGAALWWFNPTHQVRVISGVVGGIFILLGIFFLSREVRI